MVGPNQMTAKGRDATAKSKPARADHHVCLCTEAASKNDWEPAKKPLKGSGVTRSQLQVKVNSTMKKEKSNRSRASGGCLDNFFNASTIDLSGRGEVEETLRHDLETVLLDDAVSTCSSTADAEIGFSVDDVLDQATYTLPTPKKTSKMTGAEKPRRVRSRETDGSAKDESSGRDESTSSYNEEPEMPRERKKPANGKTSSKRLLLDIPVTPKRKVKDSKTAPVLEVGMARKEANMMVSPDEPVSPKRAATDPVTKTGLPKVSNEKANKVPNELRSPKRAAKVSKAKTAIEEKDMREGLTLAKEKSTKIVQANVEKSPKSVKTKATEKVAVEPSKSCKDAEAVLSDIEKAGSGVVRKKPIKAPSVKKSTKIKDAKDSTACKGEQTPLNEPSGETSDAIDDKPVRISLDTDALEADMAKVWAKFDDKANAEALAAESKAAASVMPITADGDRKPVSIEDDRANVHAIGEHAPVIAASECVIAPSEEGKTTADDINSQTTETARVADVKAEPAEKAKASNVDPGTDSNYVHKPIKPHKAHEPSDDELTLASTFTGFYSSPVSYVEFSQLPDAGSHDDTMATALKDRAAGNNARDGSAETGKGTVVAKPNDSRLPFLPKLLAVDLWSERVSEVQAALDQLAGLCAREQNMAEILKHGGHMSLSVILRKWPASPTIQATALAALHKAAESMDFSDAVVQLGALDLVLVAMKNHAANEEVLVAGCGALLNLTLPAAHAKILVFELHGIQTICAACAAFPGNIALQKYALWIIQYFSYWEDFKAPIVKAGGVQALAEMVESLAGRRDNTDAIRKSAQATMKRLM